MVAIKIIQIDEALVDIATQIDNIMNFITHGTVSIEVAEKKLKKLNKQEAKIKKDKQRLESEQSLLLSKASVIEKIEEARLWWLDYAGKLEENEKRKLVDALIERIEISPRIYSKEQAEHDDKYGGGPEAGLETKFYIEIIGHIPINGWNKIWEE